MRNSLVQREIISSSENFVRAEINSVGQKEVL
jgi:hypothetical protein